MSKVIVSNLMTVDGYVAGPGGDVMALPFDDSFSTHNLGLMQAAGTLLYGATTYAGMRDYWPSVLDDESQPQLERDIARRNHEMEKVVVSDSLTSDDTGPWRRDDDDRLQSDEAHDKIAELRRDGTDNILTFGSITLGQRPARRGSGRRAAGPGGCRSPGRRGTGVLAAAGPDPPSGRGTAASRLEHGTAALRARVIALRPAARARPESSRGPGP